MSQNDPPTTSKSRSGHGLPVEQALLLEKACDDFEAGWHAGNRPRIEDIIAGLPEAVRAAAVRELIGLDVYYRRKAGEEPGVSDYIGRFPDGPEWLVGAVSKGEAGATETFAAGGQPTAELPIGTKVGYFGDYELLGEVSRGGMGVVYKARQVSLNRVVALKMIRSGELASPTEVQRFHKEAEAAATLDHPHIVPIYEVGEHAGQHYFAMRLIEGGSLADRLADFAVPEAAGKADAWTRQVRAAGLIGTIARAVFHAHQRGILHRDLKPANVLIDLAGEPHVTDFGLARRIGQDSTLTATGAALGTPSYMAPEQTGGGQTVTTQTDVYGLGAVLYELLTGLPPFKGKDMLETLALVRDKEPTRPRSICAEVDRDLETVCLKCLSKEPSKRYSSAEALADELDRWLQGEPIRARPVGRIERTAKWVKRNPVGAAVYGLLGVVVGLGVLGGGAMSLWRSAERNRQALAEKNEQVERALEGERAAQAREGILQARLAKTTYFHHIDLAYRMVEANQVQRADAILAACPPELRHWEWHYVRRLCHGELHSIEGLDGGGGGVAIGPGGRVAGRDVAGDVKVWDVETGRELLTLKCAGRHYRPGVAYSPDGRWIAASEREGIIRVWDANSGRQVHALEGHPRTVFGPDGKGLGPARRIVGIAFGPDGKRLATGFLDGSVKVWNMATGAEERTLGGLRQPVNCLVFSPDSKLIAAGGHTESAGTGEAGTIKVWDADTGRETLTLLEPTGRFSGLTFSPDGRRLASAGYDGMMRIWNVTTGTESLTIKGNYSSPVAFSPDGTHLAGAYVDGILRVWDAATGRLVLSARGHYGQVARVAYNANGSRITTAGSDGTVKIWDARIPQRGLRLAVGGTWGLLTNVAFSADGTQVATGMEDVWLWDVRNGREQMRIKGRGGFLVCVAFSSDGRWIASGDNSKWIRIWDTGGREQCTIPCDNEGSPQSITFSPDSRHVAAIHQNTVKVWEAASGRGVRTFTGHASNVLSLAFSPDGRRVASGGEDGSVRVWEAASGREVLSFQGSDKAILGLTFSPDGQQIVGGLRLSGDTAPTVKMWSAETGQVLLALTGHGDYTDHVVFSPDGKRLVTGSRNGVVKLWDAETGQEAFTFMGVGFGGVAVSPDGTRIAAFEQGYVEVWDGTPWQANTANARPDAANELQRRPEPPMEKGPSPREKT